MHISIITNYYYLQSPIDNTSFDSKQTLVVLKLEEKLESKTPNSSHIEKYDHAKKCLNIEGVWCIDEELLKLKAFKVSLNYSNY